MPKPQAVEEGLPQASPSIPSSQFTGIPHTDPRVKEQLEKLEQRLQPAAPTLEPGWASIGLPGGIPCSIRALLYREVRAMAMAEPHDRARVLRQLVRSSTNIDPDRQSLTWPQLVHIMLWWRVNSFAEPEFQLDYACPHCGRQDNQVIFAPTEIVGSEDDQALGRRELAIDSTGRRWIIGPADAWIMAESWNEEDLDKRDEIQFAAKIRPENAPAAVDAEKMLELVGGLPNKDAMALAQQVGKYDAGLPQAFKSHHLTNCPACQKQVSVEFDLDIDFFFDRS